MHWLSFTRVPTGPSSPTSYSLIISWSIDLNFCFNSTFLVWRLTIRVFSLVISSFVIPLACSSTSIVDSQVHLAFRIFSYTFSMTAPSFYFQAASFCSSKLILAIFSWSSLFCSLRTTFSSSNLLFLKISRRNYCLRDSMLWQYSYRLCSIFSRKTLSSKLMEAGSDELGSFA